MMFVRSFCGAAPAGPFGARRAFAWVVVLFWISPALFSLIRQVKGIRYSGTGSHATLAKDLQASSISGPTGSSAE